MILLMAFRLKTEDISLTRITRTLYIFVGFFAISIVIFDSGNLITRESVVDRWSLLSVLFIANTVAWFIGSKPSKSNKSVLTYMLSISLLAFAGFMTYWERGMASTSTIFYILPLLVIATLRDRHALMAVAGLSGGTYAFSAVKYFNDYFNEGYRVQLWGNIVLYCGTILVSAWLILIISGLRKDSK